MVRREGSGEGAEAVAVTALDAFEGYGEEGDGTVSEGLGVRAGFCFEGEEGGEVGDLGWVDGVGGVVYCDGCFGSGGWL